MVSQGGFIAYYRVPTGKQGCSGLRHAAQRAAVESYLNGGQWRIVGEFTEVESGKRSDRPQLEKALAKARVHRIPVVVAKVDRLTRSVAFLSRLLEAGVDVRFADLPQIEGPTGRFMLQQMASVAETGGWHDFQTHEGRAGGSQKARAQTRGLSWRAADGQQEAAGSSSGLGGPMHGLPTWRLPLPRYAKRALLHCGKSRRR